MKVIANPIAGRGAGAKLLPSIERALHYLGAEFDVVCTTRPWEGVDLARQAAEAGYETVVAVGGDGLIQEVVNGLMEAAGDDVAGTLGVIPVGSGNDFVKMFNIPLEPVAACRRLMEGGTRLVDVGRVGDRFFHNGLGMGFDALVGIEAQKITWLTGFPMYLFAVLRTLLLTYRTPQVTIEMDDRILSQSVTMIGVGNGRCLGGGFWITPDAEIDDGLFDVAIARGLSRLGILALLPHVMKGTHVDKEPVTMAQARRIVVDSAEPLPVHADGEILYTDATHIEVEILPKRLRVIG